MPFLGEIAALFTAFCWSFTAIIFTAASNRIGSLQVNLYRLPLAIILLGTTYWFMGGSLNVESSAFLWLFASGIIGLALGDTFLFEAFVLIGSRISMLLLSLAPPMTAILAFFFLDEPLDIWTGMGIMITIAGVSWVVAERTPEQPEQHKGISLKGIIFGLLAVLGQAVGLILAKKGLESSIHPIYGTLIRMVGAMIILWPVSLFLRRLKSPLQLFRADTKAVKLMFLGVIFGPFLGITLSLVAVKYTDTGVAATLMSIVPVLMLPLVVIIEKEKVSFRAVAGAFVAVAGVALLFLR